MSFESIFHAVSSYVTPSAGKCMGEMRQQYIGTETDNYVLIRNDHVCDSYYLGHVTSNKYYITK